MTQIVRMPRSAWLYHFRKARAAGDRSRKTAALARDLEYELKGVGLTVKWWTPPQ